jgi:hypothetical protein
MASMDTLKIRALRMIGPAAVDQLNYGDDELLVYYNEGLDLISKQLADEKSNYGVSSATSAYALGDNVEALPTDFIAEQRVLIDGDDTLLTRAAQFQINDWEDSTTRGTPAYYYIMSGNLYLAPIPSVATTIKVYYWPLRSATATTDTVPWNGMFDEPLVWHMVRRMHQRSEMFGFASRDEAEFYRTLALAMGRVIQIDDTQRIRPRVGWSRRGRTGVGSHPYYYNPPNY